MNTVRRILNHDAFSSNIHWKLLLFLLLFLNVKLAVKLAAVALLYGVQPNFHFGLKWKASRLPLFYPTVIFLALLDGFIYGQIFQLNYFAVVTFGLCIWGVCLLASHQLKFIVETTRPEVIYQTLIAFFLVNTCISALQFLRIVWETGALNPFQYQGLYQKYFISTGDYIKGVSFDTSTTNAILNAFGAIYFLYKRSWIMLLVCTGTLLVTGSNLVNLVLFFTLLLLFLFHSSREQKSLMVVCGALLVVFITKVSPQNNQYVLNVVEDVFHYRLAKPQKQEKKKDVRNLANETLTPEERKEKTALLSLDSLRRVIAWRKEQLQKTNAASFAAYSQPEKPAVPAPDIHSAPFQSRDDTNAYRKELLRFMAEKKEFRAMDQVYASLNYPGKIIASLQTGRYLHQHPQYLLTGAGLGNFSSKMAFKATALEFAGGFPRRLAYINPDFFLHHLSLYTYFFSRRANAHSITNTPNSVYDQLLSEYGIVGLGSFFVFYIGFFLKQYKQLSYGLPLLFLLLNFLLIDYWFEQLSVIVLFELLLFLNLKEKEPA